MIGYCIVREDGHFYLGTVDKKPLFGHGENAAVFSEKQDARHRASALAVLDPGRSFEVVPETGVTQADLDRGEELAREHGWD